MFFGPQKVSSDYSRKKMVLLAAVVTTGAQATVLKTGVLNRTGKGRSGQAFH